MATALGPPLTDGSTRSAIAYVTAAGAVVACRQRSLLSDYLARRSLELCESDFAVNPAKVETEEAGAEDEYKKEQRPLGTLVHCESEFADNRAKVEPEQAEAVDEHKKVGSEKWADVADSDEGQAANSGFKPAVRKRKRKNRYRNSQEAASAA